MKVVILFIIFFAGSLAACAQSNYDQAMKQGDSAFNKQQYKIAINKYFAAEAFDPSKKDLVKEKVNRAFDKIETLRTEAIKSKTEAEKQKARAEKALIEAINSKNEADSATNKVILNSIVIKNLLIKSQKLIDAFYFYADRFALAFKNDRFYFIDKNGNDVSKLGRWIKAEQFNDNGFARIKEYDGSDGLIDTSAKTSAEADSFKVSVG